MKIIVLAGGTSTERDVSLSSGSRIYKALKAKGHQAVLLDVYLGYEGDTDGIFERDTDWAAQVGVIGEQDPDLEAVRALRKDGGKSFFGPHVLDLCQSADAVFMALHGANGEDGKVQACLELLGVPYTGTDFVSAAMAMDKGITKDLFQTYHIPTPAGIRLKKGEQESEKVPYPCMVKACCGGSSVGVCIARDDAEYLAAKEEAFRYDDEVIIEQYIEGREFSVGVMEGTALPVIEIAPKAGFYDYKNKYQAGSTVETCPAQIAEEQAARMQRIAERVFQALRLKSYARMDFRMSAAGEVYCLEANTLPGMTPISLFPQEAAAVGISFEDLCEKILESAVKR
ncbi:MAG: D-alanine--D-alanine ligase [Eubacterium sp.]|nr:D-alanine--D-alanine ligase [Eubacterium sp.]MCM1213664.1 D-alanine--D-alanine ligase [Lachnospiraceae bacterium]MCM1302797.1 D-alanine--D-alanine ligase [Butyrivibrio sp.]MCM1342518.1 D-alanine--D-alanine ligase [Muribaculaceae bacterium]MCM1237785.1 D-alanine--D-alanine ligase [Lachnospiraceae bacterium]